MAQRITLVDDIDGSEGAKTVGFNLAGVEYALDLTEQRSADLANLIERITPYLDAAVKAAEAMKPALQQAADSLNSLGAGIREGQARAAGRPDLPAPAEEIRAWARANGWEVKVKGKIPAKVVAAFIAADNGTKGNQPTADGAPPASAELDSSISGPDGTEVAATLLARPADDAPVEDWRRYAYQNSGVDIGELEAMNRSQIRTLLKLDQPVEPQELPVGSEWGDVPPVVPSATEPAAAPAVDAPEPAPAPEPTLGQRLHREAEARQHAAAVAREAATAAAQAVRNEAEAAEEALVQAEMNEEAAVLTPPLTPEQVDELARQEIEAARVAAEPVVEVPPAEPVVEVPPAEPVSPILPFRTP